MSEPDEAMGGRDESGAMITSPDGEVIIVKVEQEPDCDVTVDAPDEYRVKRF